MQASRTPLRCEHNLGSQTIVVGFMCDGLGSLLSSKVKLYFKFDDHVPSLYLWNIIVRETLI